MPIINISNLVQFAPNVGVMVTREALTASPHRIFQAIQTAYSHMDDAPLLNACCGGQGPLSVYSELSYEDYLIALEEIRIAEATRIAKRMHTRIRRTFFNSQRSRLKLAMIEAGAHYICAFPNCNAVEDLTVDHITPLPRGETDDIQNLRFLCRRHNSQKSDQLWGK